MSLKEKLQKFSEEHSNVLDLAIVALFLFDVTVLPVYTIYPTQAKFRHDVEQFVEQTFHVKFPQDCKYIPSTSEVSQDRYSVVCADGNPHQYFTYTFSEGKVERKDFQEK